MRQQKLHNLQVLRGLAAIFVVVSHASLIVLPQTGALALLGGEGVSLFFLISGFIMIVSNEGRFAQPGTSVTFLIHRAIRIVPMYWLATACTLAILLFGSGGLCGTGGPLYILSSLLFIPALSCEGEYQPVLSQGWTLNYEAIFYLAFAICLRAKKSLGVALLCAVLSGPALITAGWMALHPQDKAHWGVLAFFTNTIMLFFVIGLLFGLLYRRLTWRIPRQVGFLPLIVVILLADVGIDAAAASHLIAGRSLLSAIACCLVFFVIAFREGEAETNAVYGLMMLAGDASYSIYLFHIMALTIVKKIFAFFSLWAQPWLFIGCGVLFSSLVGICSYLVLEKPLLAWLRGRSAGGSLTPPSSAQHRVSS